MQALSASARGRSRTARHTAGRCGSRVVQAWRAEWGIFGSRRIVILTLALESRVETRTFHHRMLYCGGTATNLTPPFRSKPEWRLFFFRSRGVESNIFRRSRANAYVQKYVTMRVCLVQIRRDAMPTVRNVKAKFLQPFDLRGDGPFPATLYRREETREGGNPLTELNVVASVETCGWYAEIRGRGSRTSRKL